MSLDCISVFINIEGFLVNWNFFFPFTFNGGSRKSIGNNIMAFTEYVVRPNNFLPSGPALGGAGPNWEQFRSAQVASQLALKSVELVAGPNWEQLVQLAYLNRVFIRLEWKQMLMRVCVTVFDIIVYYMFRQ